MHLLSIVIVVSVFLGISMKLADLCDEHGLRWFKGDALVFGIIWGASAGVLILQSELLASIWMAILIGYLLRGKIDFINHGIAVALAVLFFLTSGSSVQLGLFYVFLIALLATGYAEDKKEIRLIKTYSLLDLLFYTLLPIGLFLLTKDYIVAFSLIPFIVAYEITKYLFEKHGKTPIILSNWAQPALPKSGKVASENGSRGDTTPERYRPKR